MIGSLGIECQKFTFSHRVENTIASRSVKEKRGPLLKLLDKDALRKAKTLASENLVHIAGDRLRLTQLGRPLVDPIAAELI